VFIKRCMHAVFSLKRRRFFSRICRP